MWIISENILSNNAQIALNTIALGRGPTNKHSIHSGLLRTPEFFFLHKLQSVIDKVSAWETTPAKM